MQYYILMQKINSAFGLSLIPMAPNQQCLASMCLTALHAWCAYNICICMQSCFQYNYTSCFNVIDQQQIFAVTTPPPTTTNLGPTSGCK